MKKATWFIFLLLAGLVLSSCYTYSIDYGRGPQRFVETEVINNHYFLWGLADLDVKAPAEPKSRVEDYRLTIELTFIDSLLHIITGGIYAPTTTIITE